MGCQCVGPRSAAGLWQTRSGGLCSSAASISSSIQAFPFSESTTMGPLYACSAPSCFACAICGSRS